MHLEVETSRIERKGVDTVHIGAERDKILQYLEVVLKVEVKFEFDSA